MINAKMIFWTKWKWKHNSSQRCCREADFREAFTEKDQCVRNTNRNENKCSWLPCQAAWAWKEPKKRSNRRRGQKFANRMIESSKTWRWLAEKTRRTYTSRHKSPLRNRIRGRDTRKLTSGSVSIKWVTWEPRVFQTESTRFVRFNNELFQIFEGK